MINFAGKQLPSYVRVVNIGHSILPTINHKTATVLGRAGAYDFGVDLGMRKISIDIQIIAANQNDIMSKATQLASWLFYEDLQPLIIFDEPDKQYMARITGETELAEVYRIGEGTLEFVCPNAYKDSTQERVINVSPTAEEDMIMISNGGSTSTYPVFEITLKEDTPALAVISDNDFLMVGESTADKEVINNNPLIYNDDFSTYTGWTTGITPDNGTNFGTFSSNGYSISQSGKDYGTGTKWHGASGIKSLSKQLQDFEIETEVGFQCNRADQTGRVELYTLDINNNILSRMVIYDHSTTANWPRVEARAGSLTGGQIFATSYGNKVGAYSDSNPAIMRLSRIGNVWNFYYARLGTNRKHEVPYSKKWIDTKGWYHAKVAKVMIQIGTWGDKGPVNTMYFSDLKVRDKGIALDDNTQVSLTLKKGDIVTFDNSKAEVLLNGEAAYGILNTSSSFFPLGKGTNGIIISPPVADVTIKYRERWL